MTESTRLNDFVFVMYATLRRNEPPSGFGNKIVEAIVKKFDLRTARDNPPSGVAFRKAFARVTEFKEKEAQDRQRHATAKDAWLSAYARGTTRNRVVAPNVVGISQSPDDPRSGKLRSAEAEVERMFAVYRSTQPAMPKPRTRQTD